MSDCESFQTRDCEPPGLFETDTAQVHLPFMSYIQGNAWAEMRARERERQSQVGESGQAIPRIDPLPSRPSTARKSSGLDYDQELALPMPKPRHMPLPEDDSVSVSVPKTSILSRARITKKRSATDPPRPAFVTDSPKVENEKKKSMVASLKSKFSLKDIGKEFRKDPSPPLPLTALPTLTKVGSGQEGEEARKTSDDQLCDFSEERLYVPKPREYGVHPSSAPPHGTATFRDSSSMDKSSLSSFTSGPAPPFMLARAEEGGAVDRFKYPLVHDDSVDEGLAMSSNTTKHLQTVLLDGSSPAARTGEYTNSAQPEITTAQQRISSMKAEEEHHATPVAHKTSLVPAADGPVSSPPSTNEDRESLSIKESDSSLRDRKASTNTSNKRDAYRPMIVSSNNNNKRSGAPNRFKDDKRVASVPTAPAFRSPHPDFHQHQFNNQMDDVRLYAGFTSHGGYAPPPPHPGYQNTVTLEQHLAAQIDSVHVHLDGAMGKLARTFENSNNWSMDQVLRQLDSIADVSRVLNGRTASQGDLIQELHQLVMNVHVQVNALQREMRQMEERLGGFLHVEINRMRYELLELVSKQNVSGNTAASKNFSAADLQGPQHGNKSTREGDKRQGKRKMQFRRKEETVMRGTENQKPSECNNDESVTASGSLLGKHAEKQTIGDIAVPTTAAHTPTDTPNKEKVTTQPQTRRGILKNPNQESSGSPEPKAPKLTSSVQPRAAAENDQTPTKNISNEEVKSEHKKSAFGFHHQQDGEHQMGSQTWRTPRRNNKDSRAFGQKSLPSTPTMRASRITALGNEKGSRIQMEDSPSSIHPALRNSRQQQVMAEREHLNWLSGQQPGSQPAQALRSSQSYQSFGSVPPVPMDWQSSGQFASPSPLSLHQNQNESQVTARYPPPSFGPPLHTFGPHNLYGAPDSANSGLGISHGALPPPDYAPPPVPLQYERANMETRPWYQAGRGHGSVDGDRSQAK